jgi:hypothetical protein
MAASVLKAKQPAIVKAMLNKVLHLEMEGWMDFDEARQKNGGRTPACTEEFF